MSNIIDNFINSINVEDEIKKIENNKILENKKKEEAAENPELGKMDTAVDLAASGATGVAHGLTYVIDLPFVISKALSSGSEYVAEKVITAAGFNTDEYQEIKSDVEIALENADKFMPGEWLRDNLFTYQPKTDYGRYIKTGAEWAAPGSIFGKTAKAKKLFTATGFGSGVVSEGTADVTGSEGAGVGVGLGVNVAADLYALKKGNLAILSKEYLPSKSVIEKAKKLEKDAKKIDKDFKLTGGESTGNWLVKSAEGQVTSTIAGAKVMNKHWENRPDMVKNFIEKWGIQNGIVIGNRRFVSDVEYTKQLKKAALALSTQRSLAWQRAGGNKLEKFFYDSQKVDDLVVRYKNLAKELDGGTGQKTILKFAKNLNNTKGNGLAMHGVYREIRDLYYSVLKNPNQTVETRSQLKVLKSMYKELDTLMAKDNPAYKKAQKAWIAYNDAYVKPITKGSATEIVSSLSKVKNELSPETAGKMWKFLDTKASPSDIAAFAKAINKSGVPGLWEDIASQYFNRAFLNSQAKHLDNGLSGGVLFHDAIMKHPKQKANFVEMLYQLAKTKNKNIKKSDVEKSVNSFANILKATGQSGKVGSTTAANLLFKEEASKNKLDFFLKGFPIKDGFLNWYNSRTFSKNAETIAKALTSDKGIQAFVDLTEDWKDYNKAISLLRAVTVGAGEME
tara:strand:+ start:999 stop:3032 length:2034 start_codon:yes stop_codon:yes gene_type:complete